MRVGDEIRAVPSDYTPPEAVRSKQGIHNHAAVRPVPPVSSVVIYIHPARRFYTVRFNYKFGSFCESFPMQKGQ